jgi:hypothetical protein
MSRSQKRSYSRPVAIVISDQLQMLDNLFIVVLLQIWSESVVQSVGI